MQNLLATCMVTSNSWYVSLSKEKNSDVSSYRMCTLILYLRFGLEIKDKLNYFYLVLRYSQQ